MKFVSSALNLPFCGTLVDFYDQKYNVKSFKNGRLGLNNIVDNLQQTAIVFFYAEISSPSETAEFNQNYEQNCMYYLWYLSDTNSWAQTI